MKTKLTQALALALAVFMIGATAAFATAPADSYYTSKVATNTAVQAWAPTGDLAPPHDINGFHQYGVGGTIWPHGGCSCPGSDDVMWYDGAGSPFSGQSCPVSSIVPLHCAPVTNVAGPFNTNDALNLSGGIAQVNFYSALGYGTPWEVCFWWDFQDNSGTVAMATALNADSTVAGGAVYFATGSVNNLVIAVRNPSGTSDPGISTYIPTSEQNIWNWSCVNVQFNTPTSGTTTITVRLPNASTQSFTTSTSSIANDSVGSVWAEGDLDTYGYCLSHQAFGCDSSWQPPTNGNPGGGASGGGGANCPQLGIISKAPKFQWCYPQLGCQNFDTGWNIGADIAWLGCAVEQVVLAGVGSVVNAMIDLWFPDLSTVSADWQTTETALTTHVPLNYAVGALQYLPNAFAVAHTSPSAHFNLPPPWNFSVNLTWAQIFGIMQPYRGIVLAFMYLTFATAVTIGTARMFERS